MKKFANYSVAIRTLGKSGELFEGLITSLKAQSIPPAQIFVYIAEGYAFPPRVADETYIRVPKGMVHQRALPYDEITSSYILFCDDDVFFAPDSVEKLFTALQERQAHCVAPNVFPNHAWSLKSKLIGAVMYGTFPSWCSRYAFRIRSSSYYSYRMHPAPVMKTQSFGGPCFLISKEAFLAAHFEQECWLDGFPYATGEDQMLAYKLYLTGKNVIVHYNSGVEHRDARTAHVDSMQTRDYNNRVIRYIIWYRTIYQCRQTIIGKGSAIVAFYAFWSWLFLLDVLSWARRKGKYKPRAAVVSLCEAKNFVESESFRSLPVWEKKK